VGSDVIALRHHLEIVGVVVVRVAVDVMDDLAGGQRPPKLLFCDDTVFVPTVSLDVTPRPGSALAGGARCSRLAGDPCVELRAFGRGPDAGL
jgi:hypothetical protein